MPFFYYPNVKPESGLETTIISSPADVKKQPKPESGFLKGFSNFLLMLSIYF